MEKIRMNKTVIIVSAVVGSLGVLSAILGFIAEGANLYNTSPALGICASLFLLAGQITVSAVGGCCGCCNKSARATPSETKRVVGVVCSVVSWILAVVALALFYRGAYLNSYGYYLPGLHAGGGVLALVATALGIASYIMLRRKSAAGVEVPVVPSTQQGPTVILVAPPQLPVQQNNPGQQLPAVVAEGHPVSPLPGVLAGGKPAASPDDVVPVVEPHVQPLHPVGTTNQQLLIPALPPQSPHHHLVHSQNGQLQQPHVPHAMPSQPTQHYTGQRPPLPLPASLPQPQALPRGNKPAQKQQSAAGIIGAQKLLGVGAQVVASLSSNNTDPVATAAGGALVPVATDSAGDDTTGATESGDWPLARVE